VWLLIRPLVLALAALFFIPILTPLRAIRILAGILRTLFVFPLILTLLPLLGILLFVLLILFGFGSRHCVPPSLVGRSQIANLFR
jgi:hypothetical protein